MANETQTIPGSRVQVTALPDGGVLVVNKGLHDIWVDYPGRAPELVTPGGMLPVWPNKSPLTTTNPKS